MGVVSGDESDAFLPPLARGGDCAPLHSGDDRETGPNFGVTIKQTVVHRVTRSIIRGIFVTVLLEHELRELFRDIDCDGLNASQIDIEACEKDAPSIDH
jgi:hypothetical protein